MGLVQNGIVMFNDREIPRWHRAEAVANAPPITEWSEVNVELLEGTSKVILQNRIKAIQQYVAGFPISEIHLTTGVHPSALPVMLRRCLTLSSDGRILGFRALIPGLHLSGYVRTKAIGFKRGEQRGGCSGMLGKQETQMALLQREVEVAQSTSKQLQEMISSKTEIVKVPRRNRKL